MIITAKEYPKTFQAIKELCLDNGVMSLYKTKYKIPSDYTAYLMKDIEEFFNTLSEEDMVTFVCGLDTDAQEIANSHEFGELADEFMEYMFEEGLDV